MEWLLVLVIYTRFEDVQLLTVGGYKSASGCLDAATKLERQLSTDFFITKTTSACVPGRKV